jgi:hypothetical protein
MEMEVVNGLSAFITLIGDDSIPTYEFLSFCEYGTNREEVSNQCRVFCDCFRKVAMGVSRDNQNVRWRNRRNIVEGYTNVVFV